MEKTPTTIIVCILLLSSIVLADNYFNISTFNSENYTSNITQDTIKEVTIPANSTMINSTLTLKGYLAGSSLSFQENATEISVEGTCIDADNLTDGNYNTGTIMNGSDCYVYFNYTFAENHLNTSLWQFKVGVLTDNATINSGCWSYATTKLHGRVHLYTITGTYYGKLECRTGFSTWYALATVSQGTRPTFYEEAIWWKTLIYPEDVTIKVNDHLVFNHTGNLTGTNTSIDLNSTYIEEYLQTNNTLPVTFNSSNWGKLEISGLDIYYEDLWECNGRTNEQVTYNFTLIDEDNSSTITGDIYVDLEYGGNVLSFQKEDTTYLDLCIGGSVDYTVTGTIQSDVGYSNKYFLTNALFTPTTLNIRLYNFEDTAGKSTLEYYVKDDTWSNYPNIIVKMERYYPANHSWLTVQQDETGEFGNTVFHIYEESIDYRFKFYSDSTLLKSTNTMKFVCTSSLCQVTSQMYLEDAATINIYPGYSFDNDTKILTVDWNDPTGATSSVKVSLFKESPSGVRMICEETTYTSSGTYLCNTTGYIGKAFLVVRSSASDEVIKETAEINLFGVPFLFDDDLLGDTEGAFWTFGFMLTISMLGVIGSATSVIIMFVFSMIFMYVSGMVSVITASFMGVAVMIGLILAIIMKGKR